MGAEQDSQIMNYLVRMVMPMRREFGRQLDVQQFLHDFAYAREVLAQALSSQDPRLLEYASYVAKRQHGARIADTPSAVAAPLPNAARTAAAAPALPVPARAAPSAPVPSSGLGLSEEELRARVLKKYTSGLR
jgi:hypothetical protein